MRNNEASLPRPLILGISGASGLIYAVRALKFLLEADYSIELVATKATYLVWQAEEGIRMPPEPMQQEKFWRQQCGVAAGGKLVTPGETWGPTLPVAHFGRSEC